MSGEFDERGEWIGRCDKCGTSHEGWPPGTFGAEVRCLRSQAEALGAGHVVDQIDTLRREVDRRRDEALKRPLT